MNKKLLILLIIILLAPGVFAQVHFSSPDTLNFLGKEAIYTHADYNGDGQLDLIYTVGKDLILKENIDGFTFKDDQIIYQSASKILTVSNFNYVNDDAFPDVVISTANEILILYGSADGNLVLDESISINSSYHVFVWTDFNQDGLIDFIYVENNLVKILYDYANANSSSIEVIYESPANIYHLSVSDLNSDGRNDLIISTTANLLIEFQNSDGSFSEKHSYTGAYIKTKQADINMDGYDDIIFYVSNENNLSALTFDSGTDSYSKTTLLPTSVSGIYAFDIMDLNGNGKADIVVDALHGIHYSLGNGDGTFGSLVTIVHSHPGSRTDLHITDIDTDGFLDVLVGGTSEYSLLYLDASLQVIQSKQVVFLPSVRDFEAIDLDKDGGFDYIRYAHNGQLRIDWTSDNFNIIETSLVEILLEATHGFVYDLEGDGDHDIFFAVETADNSNNSIYLMESEGGRSYKAPVAWKYFNNPSKPTVFDKNNDGDSELMMFEDFGNTIYWLDPLNPSSNEFSTTSNKFTISGDGIFQLATGDLNSDAFSDVVSINRITKNFSVLINDQNNSLTEEVIEMSPYEPLGVKVFDYNADNLPDIIITTLNTSSNEYDVHFYINNGSSSFEADYIVSLSNQYYPQWITINDFDVDGDTDILISSFDYQFNNLLEMNSDDVYEDFSTANILGVGQATADQVDLNNDGKLDIVSSQMSYGNIIYQLNNSPSKPAELQTEITVANVGTKSFDIILNQIDYSGRVIIVKEGSALTNDPTLSDRVFYANNKLFGIGAEIDANAYVVYSGEETEITVSNLKSDTDYFIYAVEYNTNEPDNTLILYSSVFQQANVKTEKALLVISAIEDQTFDQGSSVIINLNDHITNENNGNSFVVESDNEDIIAELSNHHLTVSSTSDYFGEGNITVHAEYGSEHLDMTFAVTVLRRITGIEEQNLTEVELYPNPVESLLILNNSDSRGEIRIFDATGMELQLPIHYLNDNRVEVDVQKLTPGLYLIKSFDKALRFKKE